jgi:hypothetical protein
MPNHIIPLMTFITLIIPSSPLCIKTTNQSSPEFFKNVFKDYANYTSHDYKNEINCLKLELFKNQIKSPLLDNFNPNAAFKIPSKCERVMSDFHAWKHEKFCKGVQVNDTVFFRYMIVLLEKPSGEVQKVEGEAFRERLSDIMKGLLSCFVDDGLIEFYD